MLLEYFPLLLLALVASISPLLTTAHLWQLKEWRMDRLAEEVRRSGLQLLLSPPRIMAALCAIALGLFTNQMWLWHVIGLTILSTLTIVQIHLRKQPIPVWTHKSLVLVLVTILINGVLSTEAQLLSTKWAAIFIIFIAVVQIVPLALVWLIFLPVDRLLKNRIYERARKLRDKHRNLTVIGIVGSVGKTTTKELLSHILEDQHVRSTPLHVNTEMGVALWMYATLKKHPDTTTLIVEMGAYKRGEIELLCSIIKPTIGIVTLLGRDHLGLFGSAKNIRLANAELLESLPFDGQAIILRDDSYWEELATLAPCPSDTVSMLQPDADVYAEQIQETRNGIEFTIKTTKFTIPLYGKHNVQNALLAIGAALHYGIDKSEIAKRLQTCTSMKHTFEVQYEKQYTLLNDTYNSSPESMHAAIKWAAEQEATPKVLLTSGIMELGENTNAILEELGEKARTVFERVIFTSDAGKDAFAKGFGRPVERKSTESLRIETGTLLVCIGRMPQETIDRFLPQ